MSYKLPFCVLLAFGIVSGVNAQESPTSASRANEARENTSDGSAPQLRSVLVGPTGSGVRQSQQESGTESESPAESTTVSEPPTQEPLHATRVISPPSAATPEASGLADRLKQLRGSSADSSESFGSSNWNRATVTGPVLTNPAAPAPFTPRASETTPSSDRRQPGLLNAPSAEGESQEPLSARRSAINPHAIRHTLPNGVLLTSQGPSLRVETRGPDAILLGKPADYVVVLINEGDTAAESIPVRVAIPGSVQVIAARTQTGDLRPNEGDANQQILDWTVARVDPGSEQSLKLSLKPEENRPFDLAVDWTVRPPTTTTQIVVQKPELELALFGPKDMLFGKTAVFTIQITNPGSGPAEDVSLSFQYGQRQLPAKPVGTLAAGEQTEVDVELTAAEAGVLRIAATATAPGGLESQTVQEVQVRRGRLEVEVIGTPVEFAGSAAKYHVRVKNVGDATAADVVANVALPRGARLVAAKDATDTPSSNVTFRIGSLSPGAERIFNLTCQLTAPGENRIEASAQGSDELTALNAFVTQVKALADLKLLVNDPQGPTAVGDDALYEMRIVNRGTRAAEKVSVVAQFSEGIEPVGANGMEANIVPGQVLFQAIPRIEPGDEVVLKVTARASKEGTHRFRAQVDATEPDTRLVAEESTYFFDAEEVSRTARRP